MLTEKCRGYSHTGSWPGCRLLAGTGYLVTSALSARRLTAPRSGWLPPASISTSQLTQLMDLKVTQELFPRPSDGIFSRCCHWPLWLVMQAGSCTLLHLPCTRHQSLLTKIASSSVASTQHTLFVVAYSYVTRWCKCCLWTMSDNILADWKIRIWVPMLQRKEIWVLNVKTCKNPTRCWFTLISAFL